MQAQKLDSVILSEFYSRLVLRLKERGCLLPDIFFRKHMVIFKLLYLLPFSIKLEVLGQNLSF